MLIYIFIGTILLGLLFPNKNIVKFLSVCIGYVIFAFNNMNSDYPIYEYIYQGYYADSVEPGYLLINNFFASSGVDFQTYHLVFASLSFILLLLSWKLLFGKLNAFSLALLYIYPFFSMIITMRWSLAAAITIFSLSLYLKSEQRFRNKVLYLLLIILAASLHYSCFFFVLILFIPKVNITKELFIKIGVIILFSTIFVLSGLPASIVGKLIGSAKIMAWFSAENRIGLGIIVPYFFHLVSFCIYYYAYKSYLKGIQIEGRGEDLFSYQLFCVNVFSFLIAGLYALNFEFFSRLYTIILIVNIGHITYMKQHCGRIRRQLISFYQLMYSLFVFIFMYGNNLERIILQILNNNSLF